MELDAQEARVFRITHIANVGWLLRNGLHCRSSDHTDPDFVGIGNPELIERRDSRRVPIPPKGTLSDYIPFYFTPHSMMMYNITTGYGGIRKCVNSDIVILVVRLRHVVQHGVSVVFTDRHAYLRTARFFASMDDLDEIDWALLQTRDFKRDPDDPEKTDRYQAEALVHRHLPVERLAGIICHGEKEMKQLERDLRVANARIKVAAVPSCYF